MVTYQMKIEASLHENDTLVFPEAEFEKHISDKFFEYEASVVQEKLLHDGMSELRFLNSSNSLVGRIIIDRSRQKILVEESFGKLGTIEMRWAGNIEEIFDEKGNLLQKTVYGDNERVIFRYRENVYGAEGIPAVERFSSGVKMEETWYEGFREPGKPSRYGVKHRRPLRESGVWKFKPTRLIYDEISKNFKAFMYLNDVLTDAPDGTPAFQEWSEDNPDERSVMRIKNGLLHGAPAIKGNNDGILYEINAENGIFSDIPKMPGMILKKDNVTLNVCLSADGAIQSREVVIDLKNSLNDFKEYDLEDLTQLLGDHLKTMLTQRFAKLETNPGTEPVTVVLKDDFY